MATEKLIKSKDRVKRFAEVYTPAYVVSDMLDMIPTEFFFVHSKIFLEPTCGNGNFLVEILRRKLKYCKTISEAEVALGSIYGIDIQQDNVDESIERMYSIVAEQFGNSEQLKSILKRNIICADSLAIQEQLINGVEWDDLDKTKVFDFKQKKKIPSARMNRE